MSANNKGGRRGCIVLFNLLTLLIFGLILIVIAVAVAAIGSPTLISQIGDAVGLDLGARESEVAGPTPTAVQLAVVPTATTLPPRERVASTSATS